MPCRKILICTWQCRIKDRYYFPIFHKNCSTPILLTHPLTYLIKFVHASTSFSGKPYLSFPSAMLFIKKLIFLARVRICCIPSSSCTASLAFEPYMPFQFSILLQSKSVLKGIPNLLTAFHISMTYRIICDRTKLSNINLTIRKNFLICTDINNISE